MIRLLSVNRSGRLSSHAPLPEVVGPTEIAQDPSATYIDYDMYLIAPTVGSLRLLTCADYFDAGVGTPVFALLCNREGDGSPVVMSVRFVANILGCSEPFVDQQHGNAAVSTVCLVPFLRPGQIGDYRYVDDFKRRWNVRNTPPVPIRADIIFRPSFDVLCLNLDGSQKLYSHLEAVDSSELIVSIKADPSAEPTRRVKLLAPAAAQEVLNVSGISLLQDGESLSSLAVGPPEAAMRLYLRMWDYVGLRILTPDPLATDPVWMGLRSYADDVSAKLVLVPQAAVLESAPSFTESILVGSCSGECDPSFVG